MASDENIINTIKTNKDGIIVSVIAGLIVACISGIAKKFFELSIVQDIISYIIVASTVLIVFLICNYIKNRKKSQRTADVKEDGTPIKTDVNELQKPRKVENKEKTLDEGSIAGEQRKLLIKGVSFTFCWCPAGSFWMGSPKEEAGHKDDEYRHRVKLSRGFWMLETPVTQKMWFNIMGDNPSGFKGGNRPVECVSWDDCQEFINNFNKGDGIPTGYKASLPSEAQWEYACRAGTKTPFNFGNILNGDKANCYGYYPHGTEINETYIEKTTEVKQYPANAWGLYDMHGNVREWCSDWYGKDYYEYSPEIDPMGPEGGSFRAGRGGCWFNSARYCRSAVRHGGDPADRGDDLGLRLALVPVK